MYQDGLLHALGDALTTTSLGTKIKESFESDLLEAVSMLERMEEKRDPIEIAYWTGRKEATQAVCAGKKKSILTYIHPYHLKPTARFVKGDAW
jgi:hypothetical protein